jgi:hypothetical protein
MAANSHSIMTVEPCESRGRGIIVQAPVRRATVRAAFASAGAPQFMALSVDHEVSPWLRN